MGLRLLKYLPLLLVALFASCGAMRPLGTSADTPPSITAEEQRRYEYHFLEAVRLEQQNRYDEAYEMLNHCLAICPTAPSALYKIANYHFVLGDKEKALAALLQAVKAEPDNYWYRQTLASYYQSNRQYDEAIAIYEEMQLRFPKRKGELLPLLVGLYSHTQQYDKVISTLSQLEELVGKSEAISIEKSRNYLLMGNKEGAFSEMEALAAEYPENTYYRVILAEVYMDHGRVAEVEPILQSILSEEPDNGHAKVALAHFYKQQADTARYHAMTDSALMSPNVDDDTKVRMMAQVIRENTDSMQVMQLFEKAVSQPLRSAKLGHLCVQYMLSHHQPEERVRPILLRMLETEPDHVQARLQLLSYAARRGDTDEIIEICSTAIDYTPAILELYYYKGIGLTQSKQYAEALNTYRKATMQIGPNSNTELVSDIFSSMGDLHHELGQTQEAYLAYDSALVYNPSNILVLNNYAYYLSEEGHDLEKAQQMSQRTLKAEPQNATYLDTYAWILYKSGHYEEALTYIKQALAADSLPSDVLYEHAGDICYKLGDIQQAHAYWVQALALQRKAETVDEKLLKKIQRNKP